VSSLDGDGGVGNVDVDGIAHISGVVQQCGLVSM